MVLRSKYQEVLFFYVSSATLIARMYPPSGHIILYFHENVKIPMTILRINNYTLCISLAKLFNSSNGIFWASTNRRLKTCCILYISLIRVAWKIDNGLLIKSSPGENFYFNVQNNKEIFSYSLLVLNYRLLWRPFLILTRIPKKKEKKKEKERERKGPVIWKVKTVKKKLKNVGKSNSNGHVPVPFFFLSQIPFLCPIRLMYTYVVAVIRMMEIRTEEEKKNNSNNKSMLVSTLAM